MTFNKIILVKLTPFKKDKVERFESDKSYTKYVSGTIVELPVGVDDLRVGDTIYFLKNSDRLMDPKDFKFLEETDGADHAFVHYDCVTYKD